MKIDRDIVISYIKSHFKDTPQKELFYEIGKILNLHYHTVYNKMNGRNDFSLVEFLLLAQALNFSVDNFIAEKNTNKNLPVFFYADGMQQKPKSILEYFENVLENVAKAKYSSESTKATFVCLQPHVFHLMKYPFLLYLKLYTYNLINWRMESLESYDPIPFIKDYETQTLIKKLSQVYQSIPVSEMMGHNFMYPLYSQLEYMVRTGIIKDPDHLKQIKLDMFTFLEELEEIASKGMKTNSEGKETPVEIYINKFIHVSNIILIETENSSLLTIQCDVPDVVKTYDPLFIEHFKHWLDSNKDLAIIISKTGGVERKDFFDRNKNHIGMVMEDLKKSISKI